MTNVKITPKKLKGEVKVPSSKSVSHRMLICAGFSKGTSVIENIVNSKDMIATINGLRAMGAEVTLENNVATVKGIDFTARKNQPITVDCNESGSTLRFFIPIVSALGFTATFLGGGLLPKRPIDIYTREMGQKGVEFDYNNTMPFTVSGQLQSGTYKIEGNVSSQFITGLIFALSLLEGDSEIILTSELQSKPYVDITIDCLAKFGVDVVEEKDRYFVKGGQKYSPCNVEVEADYSQGAFFLVGNALGNEIEINNLRENSFQGDKKILEIINEISYNKVSEKYESFTVDAKDIPDIVPILCVFASFCEGTSVIKNVARLKIKESDRVFSTMETINKLGGKVREENDTMVVEGVKSFKGGVELDGFNDHRIPMSIAIAATKCEEPITILGANCVEKSYPHFWEDYAKLGGEIHVLNV